MMNRNIAKTTKNFIKTFSSNFGTKRFPTRGFNHLIKTFFCENINITSENKINFSDILKNTEESIYEVDSKTQIADQDPPQETQIDHKNLLNISEISNDLSKFLKSLELAKTFDIKSTKTSDIKKFIPLLTKDDVKSVLFTLLSDQKVSSLKFDDLSKKVSEKVKVTQSYAAPLDKEYYDQTLTVLFEVAKFFLENNIYSVDHTVNVKIKSNKEFVVQLAGVKSILEFLNFADLSNDQLIQIFPIVVMLNNVYQVTDIVMEKLFDETTKRLNSEIPLEKPQEDLLKSYLNFSLINNFITKPSVHLSYLVKYHDLVTKNKDINDLLFILTENIFKFSNNSNKFKENDVKSFEEFLKTYLTNYTEITQGNRIGANQELVGSFLNSLILLAHSNQLVSQQSIEEIKIFVEDGVFNLTSEDVIKANALASNISNLLLNENTLVQLIEIENKLFSMLPNKMHQVNQVLSLYNINKFLLNEVKQSNFDRLKSIIFNAGEYYNEYSAKSG
jgi:hypothetical protein